MSDFKSELASSAMLSRLMQHPGFVDWWDRLNADEQRKIIEEAKVAISKATHSEMPYRAWNDAMIEARRCKFTWGMGFPVISMYLLRKFWHKATGWMPPETNT